jgi:hypothetical protein
VPREQGLVLRPPRAAGEPPHADVAPAIPASRRLAGRTRGLRPAWQGLVAFALYLAVSLLYWSLPVLGAFTTRYAGQGRSDAMLYRWSLAWTPWALSHGLDPLFTTKVFAPVGATLAWTTFTPALGVLLWPLTATFGTLVAYNVALTLAPALAAWSAYLVCRRVAGRFWPAFVGGAVFGSSAFMVGQMHGHLNLVMVFPVPLGVYLVARLVDGSVAPRAFVAWLAADLVLLFSISTELFTTATFFAAVALGIALVLVPEWRPALRPASARIASAYGVAIAVVFVPYLLPALLHLPTRPLRRDTPSIDLLSLVVPRTSFLLGGSWFSGFTRGFPTSPTEDAGYLGLPLLVALVWIARADHRPAVRAALAFVAAVFVLALGARLHVGGVGTVPLPTGQLMASLPLLQDATPQRFPVYAALAVGALVATWLARATGPRAWTRWAVALAGLALLIPAPPYHETQTIPPFIADGAYRSVLRPDEIVFVIPTTQGEQDLWQSATGFWFRMPEAYLGPVPPPYLGAGLNRGLAVEQHDSVATTPLGLALWLRARHVTALLLSQAATSRFAPLVRATGWHPVYRGQGVSVWRQDLSTGTSACRPRDGSSAGTAPGRTGPRRPHASRPGRVPTAARSRSSRCGAPPTGRASPLRSGPSPSRRN